MHHVGDDPAFAVLLQGDFVGGQILLGWPGNPCAVRGEAALVAGTLDVFLILLVIDPAAKVGANSGNGGGALWRRKKEKVVTGMNAA
jgi:hypothetical protein